MATLPVASFGEVELNAIPPINQIIGGVIKYSIAWQMRAIITRSSRCSKL